MSPGAVLVGAEEPYYEMYYLVAGEAVVGGGASYDSVAAALKLLEVAGQVCMAHVNP